MKTIIGKTDCCPEETGYDSTRIDKLDERFKSMIERRIIHGASYCIAHKGKVIAHGALGRNNGMGIQTPMQPDTVFRTASITKTFTATAVMQLVEDGILNLGDSVSKYLPQFSEKPFSDIILLHLLTHTSGLYPQGDCFNEPYPKDSWDLIEEAYNNFKGDGEFDWISAGISAGLRRPVGKEWQYSSFGFALLGEIISKASGMRAEDYIEEKIIKPLGMNDSSMFLNAELAKKTFVYNANAKDYLDRIINGEIDPRKKNTMWDLIPSTAGGLVSTVYDLVRYGNAFAFGGRFNGARLLGRKSVEKMSKVQIHGVPDYCWGANEPNRLYGIGFDIRRTHSFSYSDNTIMHEGAGASSIDIDLDEQLVAAWFVPFDEGANGWSPEPLYNVQNIIWSGLI